MTIILLFNSGVMKWNYKPFRTVYFTWFTHACTDPEQVGPALHRLSVNLPTSKGNHSDVRSLGK